MADKNMDKLLTELKEVCKGLQEYGVDLYSNYFHMEDLDDWEGTETMVVANGLFFVWWFFVWWEKGGYHVFKGEDASDPSVGLFEAYEPAENPSFSNEDPLSVVQWILTSLVSWILED